MGPHTLPGWTLRAHSSPIRTLAFAPDGLTCCSGDDQGWVVWWSLETRRPLAVWHAHSNALLTTEFWSSTEVLTHGRDNKLRIWRLDSSRLYNTEPLGFDLATATTTEPVEKKQSGCSGLEADVAAHSASDPSSEAGPRGSADVIREGENGGGLSTFYPKPWLVHAMDVNALNFCSASISPQRNLFAIPATTASEKIDVYSLGAGLELTRPHKALNGADALPLETTLSDEAAQTQRRGELGTVMAMIFYSNTVLVAGYESGHIVVFDLTRSALAWVVRPHRVPVLSLAAFGDTIWSTAADKTIGATNMTAHTTQPAVRLSHKGIAAITVLDSGRLAVAAQWDGTVTLFRIVGAADLEELTVFKGGRHDGVACARVHDVTAPMKRRLKPLPSAWIAVGGKDGRVGLFGVPSSLMPDTP